MQSEQDLPYAVRFDADVIEQRLRFHLDDFARALRQDGLSEALGEASVVRIERGVAAVHERLRRPFSLLVAGDFKRGKSTLVNALLGSEVVTMDVGPETVAITEVVHGPRFSASVRLASGGHVDIGAADLSSTRLTRILENLPAPVDVVRITSPSPLLEQVTIIDSPGTGDVVQRFDKRVQAYLPRADAVLFVISALSPLSETERSFLSLALRPLDLAKVTFVVNSMDALPSPADAERVVTRVEDGLRASFPSSAVFGVSALAELARTTGSTPPFPEREAEFAGQFAQLASHLRGTVMAHRDVVRGERAIQDAMALVKGVHVETVRIREMVEGGREQLETTLARTEADQRSYEQRLDSQLGRLRMQIAACGDAAASWMAGLVDRLDDGVLSAVGNIPYQTVQKQLPMFVAEVLRDGIAACLDAHQYEIAAHAETCTAEAGPNLRSELRATTLHSDAGAAGEEATFQPPAWSSLDTMNAVASLLGGFVGMLVPLIVGVGTRDRVEKARAADYLVAMRNAIPDLRAQVMTSTREAYAELSRHVCGAVEQAQRHEREVVRPTLVRAIALQTEAHAHSTSTATDLVAAAARIGAIHDALGTFQRELRSASSTDS
jgi:GTPase SAR1 family protein